MDNFTPVSSLAGGMLIGLAASLLLAFHGRIAGISGIVGGLFRPVTGDVSWRVTFVAGLLAGGLALTSLAPQTIAPPHTRSLPVMVLAGLVVGFGVRMGSGCTSGHGVCGISRLSTRSMAATGTFMATGIGTAVVIHWLGGSL